MASMLELQQAIDEAYLRSDLPSMASLIELQNERVNRLDNFDTRFGERGTATDNPGEQ